MNNSISEAHKTPSLIPQKKEFDQNLSENVSTISSKKNKVFEKFKSIVDSFMKFIRTYIIDKPKNFFKSCFMKKEEPLNIGDNINQFKSCFMKKKAPLNIGDNINQFRLLIKECHEKNIPYKIYSRFSREFCRAAISTYIVSINNIVLSSISGVYCSEETKGDVNKSNQFLVEKTGISKEIIKANSKLLFEYKTKNPMFLDIPSYVGKVANEKYQFLEGQSLHETMAEDIDDDGKKYQNKEKKQVQSLYIDYDGKKHNLCRAQGVSENLPPSDLSCSLYATKEEADKEIQESNKLLKAATE